MVKNGSFKLLLEAHKNVGLWVGYLFYISVVFGLFSFFYPHFKVWESQKLHIKPAKLQLQTYISPYVKEQKKDVTLTLPTDLNPYYVLGERRGPKIYLHPKNGHEVAFEQALYTPSKFFLDLHMGKNIPFIGRFLFGFMSIGMLFLVLSAFIFFVKNRKIAKKNANLFWHKQSAFISVLVFLAFLVSGAFFSLMLPSSDGLAYASTKAEHSSMRAVVRPIIFPKPKKLEQVNKPANMQNLDLLYEKAQKLYPELHILQVKFRAWGEQNAEAVFSGYLKTNHLLTGKVNRVSLSLSGASAKLIEKVGLEQTHFAKRMLSGFYYFHFLTNEDSLIRFVFFFLSLGMLVCMLWGFFIWFERRFKKGMKVYDGAVRFSAAVFIGTFLASALCLYFYLLTPASLSLKATWMQGLFYLFWLFSLTWFFASKKLFKTLKQQLFLAGALFLALPLAHNVVFEYTSMSKAVSVFNLFLISLGLCLLGAYYYLKHKLQKPFLQKGYVCVLS